MKFPLTWPGPFSVKNGHLLLVSGRVHYCSRYESVIEWPNFPSWTWQVIGCNKTLCRRKWIQAGSMVWILECGWYIYYIYIIHYMICIWYMCLILWLYSYIWCSNVFNQPPVTSSKLLRLKNDCVWVQRGLKATSMPPDGKRPRSLLRAQGHWWPDPHIANRWIQCIATFFRGHGEKL